MLATSSAPAPNAKVAASHGVAAGVALECNMDATVERECTALGCLFQQMIQDMKNNTPLWEDLISKATKLHTCLKAAIVSFAAYLEAFQKIADAATNARGATREIGTALTRICLRHKAVETRVKSFTSAIMDCLVLPLQDKLEDWKKSLVYLDKEHAKEYKKARSELKKKSSDTLRLQKKTKVRKGLQHQQIYGTLPHGVGQVNAANATSDPELGKLLESSAAVVYEKRQTLEETERKAVRMALLEERGRFCQFAQFLKPVLDEEIAMLMEMTHLQEVAEQLEKHTTSPQHLPPASEQVITDLKGRDPGPWTMATPPSSPSLSLGSRKSSVCSISSLTSSSSGSCKSHPSPSAGHPSSAWHRSTAQQPVNGMVTLRYHKSINSGSRDSGFTSLQDALYSQPIYRKQAPGSVSQGDNARPATTSTWPDLQREDGSGQSAINDLNPANERPHTISTEQSSASGSSQPGSPVSGSSSLSGHHHHHHHQQQQQQSSPKVQSQRKNSSGSIGRERPPIPNRCSSLERPTLPARIDSIVSDNPSQHHQQQQQQQQRVDSPGRAKAKLPLPASIPAHLAREIAAHQPHLFQQPMYVNMHELANLAASKAQEMHPVPVATTTVVDPKHRQPTNGSKVETGDLNAASGLVQRRNSLQQANKPSPPTRRVSAGVVENHDDRLSTHSDDLDNLPPPPAFLLEGSSTPSSSGGSPAMQRRSMSVSETVRTLTELRHTPASPSLLRRNIAAQARAHVHAQLAQATYPGNEKSLARASTSGASVVTQLATSGGPAGQGSHCSQGTYGSGHQERHSSPDTKMMINSIEGHNVQVQNNPGGVAHSFMAALSAKFHSGVSLGSSSNEGSATNSPKPNRKGSVQMQQQQLQAQQAQRCNKAPSEFLDNLNAKLAQQQRVMQHQQHQSGISLRSASVRRLMANRVPILDPHQVRDSLMDQIRRGKSLRKTTGPINDRSAPKIY